VDPRGTIVSQQISILFWRKSSRSSDPDMAQCVEVAEVRGNKAA
jgi:hypothetical protein